MFVIISETVQTVPIKFAVKIVQLEVYMTIGIASVMTLTIEVLNCVSNLTTF